eukprot:5276203-Prymnesium_polylepis.1
MCTENLLWTPCNRGPKCETRPFERNTSANRGGPVRGSACLLRASPGAWAEPARWAAGWRRLR